MWYALPSFRLLGYQLSQSAYLRGTAQAQCRPCRFRHPRRTSQTQHLGLPDEIPFHALQQAQHPARALPFRLRRY
ncbi:Uncharacterised protein [Vibrio cholerae]|nr:Uncharacterised protein [Vibrio cholerae]